MSERDTAWLHQLLDTIWDRYFSDVPQGNIVRVVFGRKAKNRLGSIRIHPTERDVTLITVNGLFRNPEIPQLVVEATLVHELSHYAHGFNSPVQQRYKYPHAGGIMRAEFRERGLEQLYLAQKRWLKQNWPRVVEQSFSPRRRSGSVRKGITVPKPFWFIGS
jgi:hypothetical protein